MSVLNTYVTIDGTVLPVYSWAVTRPSYGSIGSFHATTTAEELDAAGINLVTLGKKAVGQIAVEVWVSTPDLGDVNLFGGELDIVDWDFQSDSITLTGRDWAGVLVDTKRIIAGQTVVGTGLASGSVGAPAVSSGNPGGSSVNQSCTPKSTPPGASPFAQQFNSSVNVQNQTFSQLATYIAQRNGFKANVTSVAGEPTVGAVAGALTVVASEPRSEWTILQFMARVLGWQCFVTPDRSLYFGPPPTIAPLNLTWKIPTPQTSEFPCRDLHISYNPRRNANFLVLVFSHHLATANFSYGQIGVASPVTQQEMVTIMPQITFDTNGFFVGASGAPGADRVSALFSSLGKPVYIYAAQQDLTKNQCEQEAFRIALDIAKREYILECTIDGNVNVQPGQAVQIRGNIGPFAGTFYVNSVEHTFDMDTGWYTHVHGWTLPPTMQSGSLLSQVGLSS